MFNVKRMLAACALLTATIPAPFLPAAGTGEWTQWGGPNRNFMLDVAGLAATWPADGPKKLWSRPLGEGHSSILADSGRLYTMYRLPDPAARARRGEQEAIVAIDAATGKTVWEFPYAAPIAGLDFENGAGPHSTPLMVGTRLFAASTMKELFAFDKATGRKLWSHDLIKEYGAPKPNRGYTCSPLAYRDTIIVAMGGPNQAFAAFNQATGALVWKSGSFAAAPASPILIDVDGQTQLLIVGGDDVIGLDPADGRRLWSHPHKTEWGLNISTPVWNAAEHLLLVSSAYGTGTRALVVRQAGAQTTVTEKWFSSRMRVHIGTLIRIGDHAYGSSGDFGPAFITAIDVRDGKIAWQDRSFSRAQILLADGKLIVLDEDGTLGLATPTPTGLRVLGRAQVLNNLSWTPPTLVQTKLYLRDRQTLMALELGPAVR
jgi:outer membrane protein assembly factor BamB